MNWMSWSIGFSEDTHQLWRSAGQLLGFGYYGLLLQRNMHAWLHGPLDPWVNQNFKFNVIVFFIQASIFFRPNQRFLTFNKRIPTKKKEAHI